MKDFSRWDYEEVKTLFRFVEIKKQEGLPLVKIFDDYASKTARKPNSVRNYYYKELGNMYADENLAKEYGVNLANHPLTQSQPFTQSEEKQVILQIDELRNQGYSVRRACLELSGGDVSQMIRLQNKYRSIIKSKESKECKKINNSDMGQVIKMQPPKPKISDDEIKSLFLGLIRIVKNQEQENLKCLYEKEIFEANEKLKQAVDLLATKQKMINSLQNKLSLIKSELEEQKAKQEGKSQKIEKSLIATKLLKKYFSEQKLANTNLAIK